MQPDPGENNVTDPRSSRVGISPPASDSSARTDTLPIPSSSLRAPVASRLRSAAPSLPSSSPRAPSSAHTSKYSSLSSSIKLLSKDSTSGSDPTYRPPVPPPPSNGRQPCHAPPSNIPTASDPPRNSPALRVRRPPRTRRGAHSPYDVRALPASLP